MDTTPPACYASRTDTAAAYREVTRAAGGRFHWFGDTGACVLAGSSISLFLGTSVPAPLPVPEMDSRKAT